MVTIRRYILLTQAEMDKSLLESEGIYAFIPEENSARIGCDNVLSSIRLQVSDEDSDRARQVLDEQKGATPLTDDFIPPPEEPPPVKPSPVPAIDDGSFNAFVWGGLGVLAIVAAIAVVTLVAGGVVFATVGGVALLFLAGGLVGLVVHFGITDRSKNGRDK